MTKLLAQELHKSNPLVNIDFPEVEKLKEQYACCAADQTAFEQTQKSCQKETHILPDGQVSSYLNNDIFIFIITSIGPCLCQAMS